MAAAPSAPAPPAAGADTRITALAAPGDASICLRLNDDAAPPDAMVQEVLFRREEATSVPPGDIAADLLGIHGERVRCFSVPGLNHQLPYAVHMYLDLQGVEHNLPHNSNATQLYLICNLPEEPPHVSPASISGPALLCGENVQTGEYVNLTLNEWEKMKNICRAVQPSAMFLPTRAIPREVLTAEEPRKAAAAAAAAPAGASGLRGVFGAALVAQREGSRSSSSTRPQPQPQLHTHEKYKSRTPQPTYDWMLGRFVMDRNGVVWHKQANRASKRYGKAHGTLTKLKRWKALNNTVAAKFRKLPGVAPMLKYWAAPEPRSVPGFAGDAPYRDPPRRKVKADRRPDVGDPALRPHTRWRR